MGNSCCGVRLVYPVLSVFVAAFLSHSIAARIHGFLPSFISRKHKLAAKHYV